MKRYAFESALALLVIFVAAPSRASAPIKSEATYTFPTQSPDLVPYASFPLENASISIHGDEVEVSYDLPLELTGKPQHAHFIGARDVGTGRAVLTGDLGLSECDVQNEGKVHCDVHFKNLQIDSDSSSAYIMNTYSDPQERAARLAIQKAFDGDPIGVVEYIEAD